MSRNHCFFLLTQKQASALNCSQCNVLSLLLFILLQCVSAAGQAPVVAGFNPESGPAGTIVTITGTNFNATLSNNAVFFGSVRANIMAANVSSLTVTVPAGSTYQPLSVLNIATGLTGYAVKPFITTFVNPFGSGIPANFYQPRVTFTTGGDCRSVAIGDLDGDGKPDLAVANNESHTVSVFRNTSVAGTIGLSSFALKVDFTTALNPSAVVIADVNGDGKPELIISCEDADKISVLRNTATTGVINAASFATKVDLATGSFPTCVAVNDLDKDGHPDYSTSNIDAASPSPVRTITVRRNTSTAGAISAAAAVTFLPSNSPLTITAGDIDGDGKADIVVPNSFTNSVSVFRNTSTEGTLNAASFAAKIDFPTGASPFGVAIGDIDGDGKPDVVVSNYGGNSISVLRNTATAGNITTSSLAPKVDFNVGIHPQNVSIADLDGDGKPDIAATLDINTNTAVVLRNTSVTGAITSSSLGAKVVLNTGSNPIGLAVGDLNGDGIPEIVVSNAASGTMSVFTVVKVYQFIGTGNWSVSSNWLDNSVPPSPLSAGSEIIINPATGNCVQDVQQVLTPGSKLTVMTGKVLVVQ